MNCLLILLLLCCCGGNNNVQNGCDNDYNNCNHHCHHHEHDHNHHDHDHHCHCHDNDYRDEKKAVCEEKNVCRERQDYSFYSRSETCGCEEKCE